MGKRRFVIDDVSRSSRSCFLVSRACNVELGPMLVPSEFRRCPSEVLTHISTKERH